MAPTWVITVRNRVRHKVSGSCGKDGTGHQSDHYVQGIHFSFSSGCLEKVGSSHHPRLDYKKYK